jgi:hypothetical protein
MRDLNTHRRQLAAWILMLAAFALNGCRNHPVPDRNNWQSTTEQSEAQSCRQFVQNFYNSYFDKLNTADANKSALPAEHQVIQQKPTVLAPELSQALAADRQAQNKEPDDIVGLDFDPFIGAQDWEGKYWVNSVNLAEGVCRASVWGTDAGKKKEMVNPVLTKLGNNWVFVDFFYPEGRQHGDASLMGNLTDLRMQRAQSKSKRPHK